MTELPPAAQGQLYSSPTVTPTSDVAARSPQAVMPVRPVGLTVMAILNFILGGLGVVVLFVLVLVQGWVNDLAAGTVLKWAHYLMYFMRLVDIVLLVTSAIGYLRLRWFMGYVLGNAYAWVAVLNTILFAALLEEYGAMSLLAIIWPLITVVLLNFVFRKKFTEGRGSRPSPRAWLFAGSSVLGLAVAVVFVGTLVWPRTMELTNVEVVVSESLATSDSDPLAKEYARNISFPKLTIKRSGMGDLRLDFIVRNDNARKVTRLDVEIALLDDNGIQLAGRTDIFAHDFILGENNTPIPAKGAKYAGCEVKNPRKWKKGRVVVTITDIAVQQPPS